MPHSFGVRARTRDKYSKAYKTAGAPGLATFLTPYRVGDYVDIRADPSQQKGMPYQYYHGRTGVIFNVNKVAVGVEMTKQVRGKLLRKRIHVRIEHVKRSRCQADFKQRRNEKAMILKAAKEAGKPKPVVKRIPVGPRPGEMIKSKKTVTEVFAPLEFISNYF
jgi:large subunit ribosomal protein L21e